MLSDIPEDTWSEAGCLLVSSAFLDSMEVPTFVHLNFLWTETPFASQGPKITSSFSQVLMQTHSDNIYLSSMAGRRLGGLSVVQKQYLTYCQFPSTSMRVLYGQDTVKMLQDFHG